MTEPLCQALLAFNQRLLASHCLSEEEARDLYEQVSKDFDNDDLQFEEAMASSNAQLQYLGLEIVAISIPQDNGHKRFVAMSNKFPDDVSKLVFQKSFHPPITQSFSKLVLHKLASEGPQSRATLINLKNEIEIDKDSSAKITLHNAEDALEQLLQAKWIVSEQAGRRQSNASILQLGPRVYCELSYLLVDEFGMEADELPQQIYYR